MNGLNTPARHVIAIALRLVGETSTFSGDVWGNMLKGAGALPDRLDTKKEGQPFGGLTFRSSTNSTLNMCGVYFLANQKQNRRVSSRQTTYFCPAAKVCKSAGRGAAMFFAK